MPAGILIIGTLARTAIAVVALFTVACPASAGVSFELLEQPARGEWADFSLSRDGSQMGCVLDGAIYWWTADGGFRLLDPGVELGGGVGMAADGSAVIGARRGGSGPVPTVWYRDGSVVGLGSLSGGCDASHAHDGGYDLSTAGRVAVGQSATCDRDVAFVWSRDAGLRGLATPGGGDSRGVAVSADGRIVVGFCEHPAAGYRRPALWRDGDGPDLILGPAPAGEALGVSLNGFHVVGQAELGGPSPQAFHWTETGGVADLGSLGGRTAESSVARAVSDDGRVVGWSGDALWSEQEAFLWTAATGMRTLADILAEHGVDLPRGMVLTAALDISGDGRIVVGSARDASWNPHYWRARLDVELHPDLRTPSPRVPAMSDAAAIPDSMEIQDADMLSPFPFTKRRY